MFVTILLGYGLFSLVCTVVCAAICRINSVTEYRNDGQYIQPRSDT